MFSNFRDGARFSSQVILDNNPNFNELRDYDRGGPAKTILRPVPLSDARYMLIDWLNPFRAIYFPLAHQAGPGFEDLCVYLMVDFRLRQGVRMRLNGGNSVSLTFDRERGLTYRHGEVLSFDLKGIYDYLILPQQLRAPEKGLYTTARSGDELITLWSSNRPFRDPNPISTVRRPFVRNIDLVTVINDNFGVDVTWQPYQHSVWVLDFLVHVTTLALGFVPGVGPLLAVSFSVGMQIIMDPDGFREQNPLHLTADVIAALIGSGSSARANLPPGHQRSRAMILPVKSGSAEPTEPEPPYVKNLGFVPFTEHEGEELVEQKEEDEGDRLAEPKSEDQWEEAVEQQGDVDGEEAAKQGDEDKGKQGAEDEGKKIVEPGAKDEGEQTVEQRVGDKLNQNTDQTAGQDGYPFPESKAEGEVKSNVEEKVGDEGNQIASEDEKKPGAEGSLESKDTSTLEHKANDEELQPVKPKSEDEASHTVEENTDDQGSQIKAQDGGSEEKAATEQVLDNKETSIPERKAEDKGDPVVEPKSEGEASQPEAEKAKEEGEQGAKQNAEEADKIMADPNIEDEVKLAAVEPLPEEGSKEIAEEKEKGDQSQIAKQNTEEEDGQKTTDPDVSDEAKKPAAEPIAEDQGTENETKTAESNKVSDETKPAAEPVADNKKIEPVDQKEEKEAQPTTQNNENENETKTVDPSIKDEAKPVADDKEPEPSTIVTADDEKAKKPEEQTPK